MEERSINHGEHLSMENLLCYWTIIYPENGVLVWIIYPLYYYYKLDHQDKEKNISCTGFFCRRRKSFVGGEGRFLAKNRLSEEEDLFFDGGRQTLFFSLDGINGSGIRKSLFVVSLFLFASMWPQIWLGLTSYSI